MFADDTTLYASDENVDKLIAHFQMKILLLIEWCKMNRLDLNWSKTFFMFITSKRVSLPKTISIDGSEVQVVQSFKLLGVTLDTKLSFTKYANDIKLIAIRKMYSIKRLFFLSMSVKVQFLKTFILPYFDYCISLLIYYPKQTIQKLNNSYNFCIKKLLKISVEDKAAEDDESESKQQDEEDQVIKFNKCIKPFNLMSFQHRVINNLMNFAKKINTLPRAPSILKAALCRSSNTITTDPTNTRTTRQGTIAINETEKYSDLNFSSFFNKLINSFDEYDFYKKNDSDFESLILNNLDIIFRKFIHIFTKFNINCSSKIFFKKYAQKKKKVSKKKIIITKITNIAT
jgi:hypothetical protein